MLLAKKKADFRLNIVLFSLYFRYDDKKLQKAVINYVTIRI